MVKIFEAYFKNNAVIELECASFKTHFPTNTESGQFTFYEDDGNSSKIFVNFPETVAILPKQKIEDDIPAFRIWLKGEERLIFVEAANYKIEDGKSLVFLDNQNKHISDIYVDLSEVIALEPFIQTKFTGEIPPGGVNLDD